ncbi:hypothetical protein LTR16_001655 [Cryomyces antarcticus]|uniref:Calcineurin-like phosphoesterase domain-containing protein n=1 Tax=Cryomyces antarcticus TaxID=329879 RepID=A0ABR0LQ36_9PEZI|nr:hypothetical protein LTR39_001079 [Cryomyces antarcticus]KAK5169237.1 hypothetical protein LTR04_006073 [Oleoguttula sp. CCFEE 6159]KAK5201737.1 hypothetical protein LTR16_001655 [Cryomyces antarcticus]
MSSSRRQTSPSRTVEVRILIISDTHSTPLRHASVKEDGNRQAFAAPLPPCDVLIHCGDLTNVGALHEYDLALDMLGSIDAELKLVVAGNHDVSLDEAFCAGVPKSAPSRSTHEDSYTAVASQAARTMWLGKRARDVAVTYLEEGMHQFKLRSGAKFTVYASPYTPFFCDWAFPYAAHEDRFNPSSASLSDADNIAHNPIPDRSDNVIDIMVTHGPPFDRLDRTDTDDSVGCPHLLRATMRARPRLHCFGHIHEGWGAERVRWAADADEVLRVAQSTQEWKMGGYGRGIKSAERLPVNREKMLKERAAFVDISKQSGVGLEAGRETLMVNAAIMDVQYSPANAAWLVSLELPVS